MLQNEVAEARRRARKTLSALQAAQTRLGISAATKMRIVRSFAIMKVYKASRGITVVELWMRW